MERVRPAVKIHAFTVKTVNSELVTNSRFDAPKYSCDNRVRRRGSPHPADVPTIQSGPVSCIPMYLARSYLLTSTTNVSYVVFLNILLVLLKR